MTPDEARAFYPLDPPGLVWESVYCPPPPAPVEPPPARPGASLTLRISHFGGRHEQWHIHLLPPLLLALGDPQRLDIRREGGALVLVPVETGGWAVTQGAYTRRLCCNKAAPLIGGMVGQYRVAVERGRAVVGEKLG